MGKGVMQKRNRKLVRSKSEKQVSIKAFLTNYESCAVNNLKAKKVDFVIAL